MDTILQDIRSIEFSRIDYNKESEDYFEIIEGKILVLLSAPHGGKHYRNGSFKEEDEYTASLAIKLGEITGAYVIFVKNKTKEDPNYQIMARYKDAIKNLWRKREYDSLRISRGQIITGTTRLTWEL